MDETEDVSVCPLSEGSGHAPGKDGVEDIFVVIVVGWKEEEVVASIVHCTKQESE